MGANLDVMRADTVRMRTNAQGMLKPFVMTNLKTLEGLGEVVAFIEARGMLQKPAATAGTRIRPSLESWVSGLNQQS